MTKNDHIYQIYILYCGLANFLKIYIKYMVIGLVTLKVPERRTNEYKIRFPSPKIQK